MDDRSRGVAVTAAPRSVLAVEDVSYRYPRRRAPVLQDFTWHCSVGERVLLLGRNGAGKSTLFRLLAGLARPTTGTVHLTSTTRTTGADGARGTSGGGPQATDPGPGPVAGSGGRGGGVRGAVALMPQTIQPLGRLLVREQVAYAGWLAGQSHGLARQRTPDALARVDLTEKADQRSSTLSGGQLRRVGLAEVLIAPAPFLLLDEPFAGLDPVQQDRLKHIVASITDRGLLVSTHQIDDVVDVVDRVTVLEQGQVRADEPLSHLPTGGERQAYVKDLFARSITDPRADDA